MIVVIYLLLIGVNSSSASTDSILSYNINYHQIGNNSCSSIDISENNLNNYDLTINLTKPPLSMNNWNWEGISNSNTKTGTLLEQNEITVTKEIYVKNINKLNLLPYTSLFGCFNISQYLEYIPYILLIYPDPEFFINNVGVSEGVGFKMVNITTPWYLFSLEFVYKLEASGG